MSQWMQLGDRTIGPGHPVYIIAEMSANHMQCFDTAINIIKAAKDAGADAVKLQTYTEDTLTIDCDNEYFQLMGTPWEGRNLYGLYREASTDWKWQPKLKEIAAGMNLDLFSTPFDATAVDFLEDMDVPAYKVASFEVVDLPLLRKIASTGKPIMLSTGMASLGEIDEAVRTVRESGKGQLALLKCTSAYPAPPAHMNLRTIPHLASAFQVPVGLSDHTLEIAVPVTAVALGACIIEKHLTLSREESGPDSTFSLEPGEFKAMVHGVRTAEKALGRVRYGAGNSEASMIDYRRSLFVVREMTAGETFTTANVHSIRPGQGLHTRHLEDVMGRCATRDIQRGTPLSWDLVGSL